MSGGRVDPRWLMCRKLETRAARMQRFLSMVATEGIAVPGFIISKEADLIRAALTEIEAEFGDRETADAMSRAELN